MNFTENNNQTDDFNWSKIDHNFASALKKEIFEDRVYEKFYQVSEGDVVVDFGASIGPFTKSILNKNPSHVYAVEPSDEMFQELQNNMKNYKNVTCINYAIDNNGLDGHETNFIYNFYDKIHTSKSITFKTFLNKFNIKKIDFLKMDIEGSEYGLFNNDSLNLLKLNVKFLSAEFHLENEDRKNKFRFFRDNVLSTFKNYRVYSIDGVDIKWDLYNEHFLEYYNEVALYIEI
jgi:FkbM family methyltransferase